MLRRIAPEVGRAMTLQKAVELAVSGVQDADGERRDNESDENGRSSVTTPCERVGVAVIHLEVSRPTAGDDLRFTVQLCEVGGWG